MLILGVGSTLEQIKSHIFLCSQSFLEDGHKMVLKAIHARGGLLPASTHVYEKASSRREGYC